MLRTIILLATISVIAGHFLKSRVPQLDGRIVGGEDANIEDYPYQVSLRQWYSHICGGSIIGDNVVVTAAHCIQGLALSYSVEYGVSQRGKGGKIIQVSRLIQHANYSSDTLANDIALVFVRENFALGPKARRIDLAINSPAPGTSAVVTGWGTTSEGGSTLSKQLQKVNVTIVARSTCAADYSTVGPIDDSMLCAGVPDGGKDSCQGDSGGPLVADNALVGIVSWGVGCGNKNFPGVYSNVAFLRQWVKENM